MIKFINFSLLIFSIEISCKDALLLAEFSKISTLIFEFIAVWYKSFFKAIKGIIAIVISSDFKKVSNKNNRLFPDPVAEIYIIRGTLLNIASIASFCSVDLNVTELSLKNCFNPSVRLIELIIRFLSSLSKS